MICANLICSAVQQLSSIGVDFRVEQSMPSNARRRLQQKPMKPSVAFRKTAQKTNASRRTYYLCACSVIMDAEVLMVYDHDPDAFTQGLLFEEICSSDTDRACQELLWESTGLYRRSTFRQVDLKSGEVLKETKLSDNYFGEGLALLNDKFYQLTWRLPDGIIYNRQLEEVGEFKTPLKDGWGLTTNDNLLVATDSSDVLYWINPDTFEIVRHVAVTDDGVPVRWLNELEWIDDEIWANVWQTDCIARIDPVNGVVKSWLYLGELTQMAMKRSREINKPMDVLNGIAWDMKKRNLYVTGKKWPTAYKIKPFVKTSL